MPVSKAKKVAVGIGLGVAAATAAGYYFFGAKNAASNRKKVVKWAQDLKRDVVARVSKVKTLDKKAMKKIVNEVSKSYAAIKSIDKQDLKRAMHELEDNWQAVQEEAVNVGKKIAGVAKATVKKAALPHKKNR